MNNAKLFELGKSYAGTPPNSTDEKFLQDLGEIMEFDCCDWDAVGGQIPRLNGTKIKAMLIKNGTGGAITGGLFYTLRNDGTTPKGDVYTVEAVATAKGPAQILIDPFLASTVANGEICLGIVSGLVPVTSSAALAIHSLIVPTTGGKAANPSAGDEWASHGYMVEAAGAANQSKLAVICNRFLLGLG